MKPATPLQPLPFSTGSINKTIAAADGEYVAETASIGDAKYIVAACNAYPKLLECLRSMGTDDIANHYAIEKLFKELGEEM